MSRIGNRPITISSDVSVTASENKVTVKSQKGEISFDLPKGISLDILGDVIKVKKNFDNRDTRALHGLCARIIKNMITDVNNGYSKTLEFKGTGYRVKVENGMLVLNMGYSHDVILKIPDNLNVNINKNKIIIEGVNRVVVGQFASQVRDIRPPEVYKGKGIKYDFETIKKKAGKAAQTTTGKA
jgi:large subunit ribosomal protein L6